MEWTIDIGRSLGRNHGRNGHESFSLLPLLLRSTGGMAEYDQGEVDYAMALSLSEMESEEQQKLIIEREQMKAIKAQVEEDQQFANALQLSIVMVSSLANDSAHASSSKAVSSQPGASASKVICAGCNTEISRRERTWLWNDLVWHVECLQCHACKRLIKDDKLCMFENRPYHTSCPRNMNHPKCYVCNNFIPYTNKVVEFREHPFWAEKYCPSHENDGTSKCVGCERLQGNHHLSETRGLCLSEEQTIPIIHKGKHNGIHSILDMLTQPRKLVRTCEVTGILILYGLPRLLTGSILAHEMMHAWLRLEGYPNLRPEIEEGICQVLAHMWLKSKINVGSEAAMAASSSSSLQPPCSNKYKQLSKIEKKLGECFIRQIELDASFAYGDGFRVGDQAVSQYGLKATLDHIKLTRTFPF